MKTLISRDTAENIRMLRWIRWLLCLSILLPRCEIVEGGVSYSQTASVTYESNSCDTP